MKLAIWVLLLMIGLSMAMQLAIGANNSPTTAYQFGPVKFNGPADFAGNPIVNASNVTTLEAKTFHTTLIAGGAAGNHTLTGVHVGNQLYGVTYFAKPTYNVSSVSDLLSQFTGTGKGIIATNVINNSGGTDTTGGYLLISWGT